MRQRNIAAQKHQAGTNESEALVVQAVRCHEQLLVREARTRLLREQTAEQKITALIALLPFILAGLYFIDLMLSQDALDYLLPGVMSDNMRIASIYAVPCIFVIFDVAIGLSRVEIKTKIERDETGNSSMWVINLVSFFFCIIMPLLATGVLCCMPYLNPGIIIAKVATILLGLILHGFVIYGLPKEGFDIVLDNIALWHSERQEQKLSDKIHQKNLQIFGVASMLQTKAQQYGFRKLHELPLSHRTRFILNQLHQTKEWLLIIENDPKIKEQLRNDDYIERFAPYIEVLKPPMPPVDLPIENLAISAANESNHNDAEMISGFYTDENEVVAESSRFSLNSSIIIP